MAQLTLCMSYNMKFTLLNHNINECLASISFLNEVEFGTLPATLNDLSHVKLYDVFSNNTI